MVGTLRCSIIAFLDEIAYGAVDPITNATWIGLAWVNQPMLDIND